MPSLLTIKYTDILSLQRPTKCKKVLYENMHIKHTTQKNMAGVSLELKYYFAILLLLYHAQQIYCIEPVRYKETVKVNVSGPLPRINQRSHL